jgi:hypothetical protein
MKLLMKQKKEIGWPELKKSVESQVVSFILLSSISHFMLKKKIQINHQVFKICTEK